MHEVIKRSALFLQQYLEQQNWDNGEKIVMQPMMYSNTAAAI